MLWKCRSCGNQHAGSHRTLEISPRTRDSHIPTAFHSHVVSRCVTDVLIRPVTDVLIANTEALPHRDQYAHSESLGTSQVTGTMHENLFYAGALGEWDRPHSLYSPHLLRRPVAWGRIPARDVHTKGVIDDPTSARVHQSSKSFRFDLSGGGVVDDRVRRWESGTGRRTGSDRG